MSIEHIIIGVLFLICVRLTYLVEQYKGIARAAKDMAEEALDMADEHISEINEMMNKAQRAVDEVNRKA